MKPVQILENLLASTRARKVKSGFLYLIKEDLLPEVYEGIKDGDLKLKGGNIYLLYGEDGLDVYLPAEDGIADDSNSLSGGGASPEDVVAIMDEVATEVTRQSTGDPEAESSMEELLVGVLDSILGMADEFAPKTHNHSMDDVNGLPTALAGKANTSHTHTIAQVTGLQAELNDKADSSDIPDVSGFATTDALTSGLAGKANSTHTHAVADITGLEARLTAIEGRLDALEGEG